MFQKFLLAMIFGCSLAAHAETKLGLVDMQKAIESTTDGKKAKETLEADYRKRKKDLDKEEAEVRKLQSDFEKKAAVLSDDVRKTKQQELQGRVQKFQEMVAKNQQEIQKRQNDLILPISGKIRKVIEGIAKKENFSAVLEKSDQIVFYASSSVDLTDRVIKDYNSQATTN